MNKNEVRGLKWNLKKFKMSVLHFTLDFTWLYINTLLGFTDICLEADLCGKPLRLMNNDCFMVGVRF